MLESFAAWVLNTYLGEYVEDLNTDQLSIGIVQGEVNLENLPIKKDALKYLDLPLEVRTGYIGSVKLQIPWSGLKSQPTVISIERLYLVVGPLTSFSYNVAEEEALEQARKQQQLKTLEAKWKAQREAQEATGSLWWSMGASLATNVLENVQLKVKDVHIRYEDKTTIEGETFACGVSIKSLTAQSTDNQWEPKFVSREGADMMFKLVDLKDFAVYWDVGSTLYGDMDRPQFCDAMQREMGQCAATEAFKEHDFILAPISMQAKMRRNMSGLPLRTITQPRVNIDMQLDTLTVRLSDQQYQGLVAWVREFSRHNKASRYRRWRPTCPLAGHPREWWLFAISSHLHRIKEQERRLTLAYLSKRAKNNVEYVKAYAHHLTVGARYVTREQKKLMEEVEEELTFEELKDLREVAMERVQKEQQQQAAQESTTKEQDQQKVGMFQRWFPSWSGWYSTSQDPEEPQAKVAKIEEDGEEHEDEDTEIAAMETTEDSTETPGERPPRSPSPAEEMLEQEIRDVIGDSAENNTFLKRDTVFAHLSFQLTTATFQLSSQAVSPVSKKSQVLLEVECSEVQMDLQSRLRSGGFQFSLDVAGCHCRDKLTPGSLLPVLIAPQTRESVAGGHSNLYFGELVKSSVAPQVVSAGNSPEGKGAKDVTKSKLLQLVYERRPLRGQFDYRLKIHSEPVDIIYNPELLTQIKELFTVKKDKVSKALEQELAEQAAKQYEALKQRTARELQDTMDKWLESTQKTRAKRWDFDLDIAAPQIIMPQSFVDASSPLVVFDLGRLKFMSADHSKEPTSPGNESIEEDDFVTPSSTPPNEPLSSIEDLTSSSLRERFYDRYTLELSELQVMVGKARDNWRHAHIKGTSNLHVLDKFSISLHLERRLIYMSDPQWPRATLAGTLPNLILHVNEQKVLALRKCIQRLGGTGSNQSASSQTSYDPEEIPVKPEDPSTPSHTARLSRCFTQEQPVLADARQMLMQFTVNNISLEVQSRGRSVAELQVKGVGATVTWRPQHLSVTFTVQSMLVVDALQMFGEDFELLLASHKSLCMDSMSGSILDSDPNSPTSPVSPSSPAEVGNSPPTSQFSMAGLHSAVTNAFQAFLPAGRGQSQPKSNTERSNRAQSPVFGVSVDHEALITIDLERIEPNAPGNTSSQEILQICSVQFNNLDLVANQQTIVELLSFLKRVGLQSSKTKKPEPAAKDSTRRLAAYSEGQKTKTEITADFSRLNVLLMCTQEQRDGLPSCRKVATATMSGTHLQATLGEDVEIEGSVDGLQLLDLTPEGRKHRKIFSVGLDISAAWQSACTIMCPNPDMYRTAHESMIENYLEQSEKAITFSLFRPKKSIITDSPRPLHQSQIYRPKSDDKDICLKLRMASMCYTHSPYFLKQLSACASAFKEYMARMASSLKYAATEVAKGLVERQSEFLSTSIYGSAWNIDSPAPHRKGSIAGSALHIEPSIDETDEVPHQTVGFLLDAVLQTPVIVIPRRPDSYEVLVAQLGKITVKNKNSSPSADTAIPDDSVYMRENPSWKNLSLELRDMSCYSCNLDRNRTERDIRNSSTAYTNMHLNTEAEAYLGTKIGIPILHDTVLDMTVGKKEDKELFLNKSSLGDQLFTEHIFATDEQQSKENVSSASVLEVSAKLLTPLKLTLSKQVYEQIMKTLDNLTPSNDFDNSNSQMMSHRELLEETTVLFEPGMSTLTVEDSPSLTHTSIKDHSLGSTAADSSSRDNLQVKANFRIDELSLELRGDFGETEERGLVELQLTDFVAKIEKSDPAVTHLDFRLQSLTMEDLLQDRTSRHRKLMVSHTRDIFFDDTKTKQAKEYMSVSCPDSTIRPPEPSLPHSLPTSSESSHTKPSSPGRTPRRFKSQGDCPCTPPPSPNLSRRGSGSETAKDALVHLQMQLVDKNSAEYITKYNRTNRLVDVQFSSLDMVVNLQTWVVVLDFFGIGTTVHDPAAFTKEAQQKQLDSVEEHVNTEMEITMQSFTLLFNKPEYEIARSTVSRLTTHVSNRDGNIKLQGQLGSLLMQDVSPHGELYRDRFITTGQQALDFYLFKYGTPDPDLLRDHDINIRLRMSSVWVVHTHRFMQELLAFAQNFMQLQDVLGRMRAASAGKKVAEKAFRGARIKMDIEAGAPIILIPMSSRSNNILVANLGTLTIKNKFLHDGDDGTIRYIREKTKEEKIASLQRSRSGSSSQSDPMTQSFYGSFEYDFRNDEMESPLSEKAEVEATSQDYRCLLDIMSVDMADMDLFSAELIKKDRCVYMAGDVTMVFPSFVVKKQGNSLLKECCHLALQVERNLESSLSHTAPDLSFMGSLSSVHCSIDVEQYKLIRGLLSHNFGEPIEQLERKLLDNLQDPRIHTVLSGEVWESIAFSIDLQNVTVELLVAHGQADCEEISLAKLDFVRSQLRFHSFSDGSKDSFLMSHEILVSDTRYTDAPVNTRPNVFSNILQPSRDHRDPSHLQLELHYRSSKELVQFTAVLNHMRIMGIFDWLLTAKDFLMSSAPNPFESGQTSSGRSSNVAQPVGVGIVTKRAPVSDKSEQVQEFRLNVSNTELVVVEDPRARDTNAVILKATSVFTYKPSFYERPLSFSLEGLEVFSCSLAAEDETALSIIDPMSIGAELISYPTVPQGEAQSPGLLDATGFDDKPPTLEVSFSTLHIRLSYNDLRLFLGILNSVPKQALEATTQQAQPKNAPVHAFPAEKLHKLQMIGFSAADCERALTESKGQLEEAAIWLTENATAVPDKRPQRHPPLNTSAVELKCDQVCVCLIDDCMDADVPLAEISISDVSIQQKMLSKMVGHAECHLSIEYYNRNLSGWEPFLEPWTCRIDWDQGDPNTSSKLVMKVTANEMLNLNVTRTLLQEYDNTKQKWTDDYYKSEEERLSLDGTPAGHRRRVPFIPFMLGNETGLPLHFATVVTAPTRISPMSTVPSAGLSSLSQSSMATQKEFSKWKQVEPGQQVPFMYEEQNKMRHKSTRELKVHQLVVKVQGWKRVEPVTVDRVGVYFRDTESDPKEASRLFFQDLPPSRVVFDVKLQGSARKLISVRSALMLHNKLNDTIEVKLEGPGSNTDGIFPVQNYGLRLTNLWYKQSLGQGQFSLRDSSPGSVGVKNRTMKLEAHSQAPVPLHCVSSKLYIRPSGWSLTFCNKPIHWNHVTEPSQWSGYIRSCDTIGGETESYKFCVSVTRLQYPVTTPSAFPQPGHVITVQPLLQVINLLPLDIQYYFKQTDISGSLKPGKTAAVISADITQDLTLGIMIENFKECRELVIPSGTTDYKVKLRLYDYLGRCLELGVRISCTKGGSLKLFISAPFWLVNRSGLPLVFRQDNAKMETAGQGEEHEIARSVAPLLFSFSDKEAPQMCCMRLGKSVHGPRTLAKWCQRFPLESGIGVRHIQVAPNDTRPDWVYQIGIEVRQGRGLYRDTNIVTFSPRYQLDNQSQYRLAFAQRHMVQGQGTKAGSGHLSAVPGCKLSFHWPRNDLDPLLCVRPLHDIDCHWSGGFRIDQVNSFHVNIRGMDNECLFIRVDVALQGATFFVVFSDASKMPPPYRIDNFSEVQVRYHQSQIAEEWLRTTINARSSVAYAWDEPTLDPYLTLSVPGGTKATYNMDVVAAGEQLCYENFIYIAFTATFSGYKVRGIESGWHVSSSDPSCRELVLDVPHGQSVLLKRKEPGKRSQLWRMTSSGMLQHEGSSPPQDPRRKTPSSASVYVLDIAGLGLQPGTYIPLALKKVDERRRSTQTWVFTSDGCLKCALGNLFVQATGGTLGLRDGAEAVLGPSPRIRSTTGIPMELAVHREKSRPGSGLLSVSVLTDGPTRVLQIMDVRDKQTFVGESMEDSQLLVVTEKSKPLIKGTAAGKSETASPRNIQLSVQLKEGLGVSLVNHAMEELIFMSFRNIDIQYNSSSAGEMLNASVSSLQIDNQLNGTLRPVLLYVTSSNKKGNGQTETPQALQIRAHRTTMYQSNAHIYKHLSIMMTRLSMQIEERLLWKLIQFLGYRQSDTPQLEENILESQRMVTAATSAQVKRHYFGALRILMGQLTMSMHTNSFLAPDLLAIKRSMGVPLIQFEDAKVELAPFERQHLFETGAFLQDAVQLHFKEELKRQAAKILGSVDFLGNPLGLFNDVTEGISGLITDANVGGLFKNITHGVSNSAAKVAGSLSDGVGLATFDDRHQRVRQQIREHPEKSSQHLIAGIKGLGHGMLGGITSIVSQTITGAQSDGIEGLFTGFGKGVVGTVTKPVAGVLDFASSTASALRDSSKRSSHQPPPHIRPPRCTYGVGGLLPVYSVHQANNQQLLFKLNGQDFTERYIAMEVLRIRDRMRALITNRQFFLLGSKDNGADEKILQVSYSELLDCRCVLQEGKYYIQVTFRQEVSGARGPLVRCDSETVAHKASQQILYARNLYYEAVQTVPVSSNTEDENE